MGEQQNVRLGYVFIWVKDVEKAVEFYEAAFGLKRRFLADNGNLGLYAELDTGGTTLAIADDKEAQALFAAGFRENDPAQIPGAFQVSFVSPDVEATYETTLKAGASLMNDPHTEPWGQTIARVRDPNGVLVSIASPLPPQA